jgi:hypothetical protein
MNDATELGKTYPAGHPSGRAWEPPVSVKQVRARVLYQMDHLEENCRIGLDVGYALQCLDEATEDYVRIVVGA